MAEDILGTDITFLYDFDLGASGAGKMASGRDCLAQDLLHALSTPKGSLPWHPEYGVDIYRFIKMADSATNRLDLEQEIRLTVEADPRVELGSVRIYVKEWDINKIFFKVTCTPITKEHPLNLVLGYGAYSIDGKVVAS